MRFKLVLWLFIFVLPVLYFLSSDAIQELRLPVLLIITGIIILLSRKKSKEELGFSKFKYGIKEYSILLGVLLLGIIVLKLMIKPETLSLNEWHFMGLFIPLSFAQEFLYRSYFYSELKKDKTKFLVYSSVLYAFLHVIFDNPITMFFIALITGLAFGYTYYKKPNFWLISIVHTIANFFAVWMGFFV